MSKEAEAAEILLDLLEDFVRISHIWEDHHVHAISKVFPNQKAEETAMRKIQNEHTLPLMQRCVEEGYTYSDLMLIVPQAFKTSKQDRDDLLDELTSWAERKYQIQRGLPF